MNEPTIDNDPDSWELENLKLDVKRTLSEIKESLRQEDYKRGYALTVELCEYMRALVYDGEY